MAPNSTATTATATQRARKKSASRNGKVWPMPPKVVIKPQTPPRIQGRPLPLRTPSSERASAKPILIPAPSEAAIPTRKAVRELWVANAAAKTGAKVETDPSIKPARPGWTIWRTKILRFNSMSILDVSMRPLEFPWSLPGTPDDGCGVGEVPLLDEKPKTHISLRSSDCWRWRKINKKEAASGLSERIGS